ncbi:hypothetical protein [Peristeroidobacter agariperforans]|uniref:hypothetical protein n=1 Tax=Peristeroidobacter agariperforans TaxID=268404 RepID=UPI00101C6202|nr:hypothetical protein [Peristeroidobacter agariperforans]
MTQTADIIVFSKGERPILVVETKAAKETSPTAAARFRRNLVESKMVADVPFLAIAFKTSIFIWRKETPLDAPADFSVPIKPVFQLYLKRLDDSAFVGEESIQIAVHSWLRDLAIGIRKPDPDFPPDKMLLDSGIYKKMHFGDVRSEFRI